MNSYLIQFVMDSSYAKRIVNESRFNSIHLLILLKEEVELIKESNPNPKILIHLINESNPNQ